MTINCPIDVDIEYYVDHLRMTIEDDINAANDNIDLTEETLEKILLEVAKEIIKHNPEYKKLVNPPKEEEEFKFIFIQ